MSGLGEKFDKIKNPKKYLTESQINEGDDLAKKISYFKAFFMLVCQIIIGVCTLAWYPFYLGLDSMIGGFPLLGSILLIVYSFFSYKNYKRELKFIEKEFSEWIVEQDTK